MSVRLGVNNSRSMGGTPLSRTPGKLAALALVAAIAVVAGGSIASGAKKKGQAANLYVMTAARGELQIKGKGVTGLTLFDPHGDVTAFTDRPARRAGHQKLGSFVRSWNRLGFREVPPNAALVIAEAPSSRDVLVVELSKPRLGPRGDSVSFRAQLVKGSATDALSRFRKRGDRRVADEFGELSLFIDPSGESVSLNFELSNIPPEQPFVVGFTNTVLAHGTFATRMRSNGPVDGIFNLNGLVVAASGSVAVSASAQSGAEVAAGASRVTGTVESLPTGSSATLQVSDDSGTGPAVPLALGRFSVPIP
jgi:hypothetical protein